MSAVEPPFLAELRQEFARVAEADAQASAAKGAESGRGRLRIPRLRLMGLRTALPVLAAVAALGGGTLVAVNGISLSDDAPPVTTAPLPQGASGFSVELVRGISALARVHTEADAIDPAIVDQLPAGLLLESSLLVDPPPPNDGSGVTPSDSKVWLVPTATGHLALVMSVRGLPTQTMEGDLADVARGRMIGTVDGEVTGVVPDGTTQVTANMRDGAVALPVRDNVFGGHLPSTLVNFQWDGMTRP